MGNDTRTVGRSKPGSGKRRRPTAAPASPAELARAEKLAARSGIPADAALQVVRGEKTLGDVLEEMWARERRDKLVAGGLAPHLAGQVARGRLDADRANKVQKLWEIQKISFHCHSLRRLGSEAGVVLAVFGRGMLTGQVVESSRYTFKFRFEGSPEIEEIKKHDLKFYAAADCAVQVLGRLEKDPEVAALKLGASTALEDRYRPDRELAVDWLKAGTPVRLVFRDGDVLAGVPLSVTLYEVEMDCGDGASVTVMTHAIFRDKPTL